MEKYEHGELISRTDARGVTVIRTVDEFPLASLALGNGLAETRGFDTRYYFPAAIEVGSVLDWQYATDSLGNVTSISDALSPTNDRVYGYKDIQYYLTQGDGPWGDLA